MTGVMEAIKAFFKSLQCWIIIAPWEQGVRVRFGKWVKKLNRGTHFKIPVFDRFYVQSIRMRITGLSKQTITTADGKTITLCGNVGYCIDDIMKLYNTMHHADDTIQSMAKGIIAQYVSQHLISECEPQVIESETSKNLDLSPYGIGCGKIYITDFSVVKTYRIIGDTQPYTNTIGGGLNTERATE